MKYINRLASVLITVFIPFVIMAWLGKQLFPYQINSALNPNEFTFTDLRIYFSHTMPLLYTAAVLMHILFVGKLFHKLDYTCYKQLATKFLYSILICSVGLSVLIWQPDAGLVILLRSVGCISVVQVVYWLLTFGAIKFIENLKSAKLKLTSPV
ncbi:hypothetical protein [Mucilaginibacter sp. KACC 22063]|uniref:hypothetical protein n=1 Tax=Mucilaginibacter sp. KACC 22063 TaxID=3025666 RepID=UPI002365D572|nr:hypothetical protein [Mucilaginibacter sp. KACC 22063]WDF54129.1 hypothetical protein PQ461_14380 [Mucilaginibacter sp. KACC 22063]